MELTLLFDHPQYVVCLKPPGVESEHQLPELLSSQTGHTPYYPVHRLDRETAGVMVFAKTKQAAAHFSKEIAQNRLEKVYHAVVKGLPTPPEDTLTDLLFRDKQKNKSFVVKRPRKGVKEAVLSYRTLAPYPAGEEPHTLLEVRLQTGRTHQIRVQFSARQMPLLGDKKYGGDPHPTLWLKAVKLGFVDPLGEKRQFTWEEEIPSTT